MKSKERELLRKVWEDLDGDRDNCNMLREEIEELLAQSKQESDIAVIKIEWYEKGYKQGFSDTSPPKRDPLSTEWDCGFEAGVGFAEKFYGVGGDE
jgi:hypothetical protein